MALSDIINPKSGQAFMMCNEAIVRAGIESDVKVVSFYPGAPTSEILDTFGAAQAHFDYHFSIATNEKVALETVAGASMAGFRTLTSMKSVGLNVAADAFFSLGYTGTKGGMVVVVADDPHCHSSQSEEDGRFFGPGAYIPMMEPADPSEARRMVMHAFEVSERHRVPVLVRTTTRVNHQSGIVRLGPVKRKAFKKAKWSEVGETYFTVGEIARRNKLKALERAAALQNEFEDSAFNVVTKGKGDFGIITSGVGYCYAVDAGRALKIKPHILKLGTTYPLPEKKITAFLKPLKRVAVVEELSPYLEHAVKRIIHDQGLAVAVMGKGTGHFSEALEYNVSIVAQALAAMTGADNPLEYETILKRANDLKSVLPDRIPIFCAGCPHRATLRAIQQAIKGRNVIYNNDIGCYSMAFFPPLNFSDSMLCMGASLGLSAGMAPVLEDSVMAMVGDSTFFHAALPGLVNAVYQNLNITIFILDNEVTAMTGQQVHMGTPEGRGMPPGKKRIMIEEVCRAIGVEHLKVVDAYDVKGNVALIKAALDFQGPAVIVFRRSCALHGDRIKRRSGVPIIPNAVDKAACQKPHACIREFYCPAITFDADDRAARIQPETCDGCGVCAQICRFGAIHPVSAKGPGKEKKK
ncbi:MAG: indolepyruvate ferredoxin oxidoreductase subunit alpha [Desulfobacterales bacterium]|nr:indolepyruvate ferredoxin oxidoreductase subunit alpha [Desulfobacterales bacterium]